jgi:prepilin-type N-terminal cleavage/methylation domain-containing protein
MSILPRRPRCRAFTLVELLVAVGLSGILLMVVAALAVYGARSFAALGNYSDLDARSRQALDLISREFRQATAVVAAQTNLPTKYIALTNASNGTGSRLTFDSSQRTLVLERTGQPAQTLLTECDRYDFFIFNRAPNVSSSAITFNPAASLSAGKLINMSWKCSRTILGQRVNTESVQTAQVVLRNKVR